MELEEWVRGKTRKALRRVFGQSATPGAAATAPETDANFNAIPLYLPPPALRQNPDGSFPFLAGYDVP